MPATPPPTPENPTSNGTYHRRHRFGSHIPVYNTYPIVNGTLPIHHGVPHANPFMYIPSDIYGMGVTLPAEQAQPFIRPEMYYSAATYYSNNPATIMYPNSYHDPCMYPNDIHHHSHIQPQPMQFSLNPSAEPFVPKDISEEENNSNHKQNANDSQNTDNTVENITVPHKKQE